MQDQKIEKALQAVATKRNLPVLLMNLDEVSKPALLDLQKALHKKQFEELDVILQTPGGDIDAAYLIIKLLKQKAKTLNIFVPLFAKSAGTLICLAADKLYLADLSELGPLDTQIPEARDGSPVEYISALNGFKALEQVQVHSLETLDVTTKLLLTRSGLRMAEAIRLAAEFTGQTSGSLYAKLDPMRIGEYARALEVGEQYGIKVLMVYKGWPKDKAKQAINSLVKGYPHHGYVIDSDELAKLGLASESIDENITEECLDLRNSMLGLGGDMILLVEPKTKSAKQQEEGKHDG